MSQQPVFYLSYLLRLWREEHAGEFVWRASLESVQTRERQGFASLQELFVFLTQQVDVAGNDGKESRQREP
ncbi:MAG: hypothetical protein U0350_33495 [Caldilineaceae bacterium]